MIITTGSILTNRFGETAFQNAFGRGGSSATDRSRLGASPISASASASTSAPNIGRADNPSGMAQMDTGGNMNTTINPAGVSTTQTDSDGQELPAHYSDQYLGGSVRAPMHSKGEPDRKDNSKNIFFRFHGDDNKDVPGIWLYINPVQLNIKHSKKLPEQMTRGGFVIFHWGDSLDEISASAITGSFARPDCKEADAAEKVGYDKYTGSEPDFGLDRRDTWPYVRFMQLLALYRNNGIYSQFVNAGGPSSDQTGGFENSARALAAAFSNQGKGASINKAGTNNNLNNLVSTGSVNGARNERPAFAGIEMHYDDNVFIGYFTDFNWQERAEEPFKFSFDFRFVVLNTEYNRVFQKVYQSIKPNDKKVSKDLLANFQVPRFNSL